MNTKWVANRVRALKVPRFCFCGSLATHEFVLGCNRLEPLDLCPRCQQIVADPDASPIVAQKCTDTQRCFCGRRAKHAFRFGTGDLDPLDLCSGCERIVGRLWKRAA